MRAHLLKKIASDNVAFTLKSSNLNFKHYLIIQLKSFNNFCILSSDKIISYIPGPNLDPVKAILIGWPTPLKFVLWVQLLSFFIDFFLKTFWLFNHYHRFSILFKKSSKVIFFAKSSIDLISSSFYNSILSVMIYCALL